MEIIATEDEFGECPKKAIPLILDPSPKSGHIISLHRYHHYSSSNNCEPVLETHRRVYWGLEYVFYGWILLT